jgi:hypothetical protein
MVPPTLASFIEEGLGIHIATRSYRFEPNGGRALAVKVSEDGALLTVYLATVALDRLLPDLQASGQAAVGFARPVDEKACQLKGLFVSARPARQDERSLIDAQWNGFLDNLGRIGIPREPLARWTLWPASAVTIKVTAIFEQTPGPGAGEPMR